MVFVEVLQKLFNEFIRGIWLVFDRSFVLGTNDWDIYKLLKLAST